MDFFTGFFIFIGLFIAFELWFFLFWKKRKRLPKYVVDQIEKRLAVMSELSVQEQVMEYDKILDACLKHRGYTGTLGEKMKRFGKNFKNENAIWSAHKLRNRIAHDIDFHPSEKECEKAVEVFKKEIRVFLPLGTFPRE